MAKRWEKDVIYNVDENSFLKTNEAIEDKKAVGGDQEEPHPARESSDCEDEGDVDDEGAGDDS